MKNLIFLTSFFNLFLMISPEYNEKDILQKLDALKTPFHELFPQFDNALQYPINSRIHLYGDNKVWNIVFEIITYDATGYTVSSNLYYFGNSIDNEKIVKSAIGNKIENMASYLITSEKKLGEIEDILESRNKSDIWILGEKKCKLQKNLEAYKKKKIRGLYFKETTDKIDILSALRLIDIENPLLFKTSESDIINFFKNKATPKIMTIENWHHENYLFNPITKSMDGIKPSHYETFQLIAKILVTKNKELWKPTLKANNHWCNWPKAGEY